MSMGMAVFMIGNFILSSLVSSMTLIMSISIAAISSLVVRVPFSSSSSFGLQKLDLIWVHKVVIVRAMFQGENNIDRKQTTSKYKRLE
ncbi:MAG: hypothetical protein J3R72DRAFT_444164 [Linnemannia gamsii]|nr:MAG: hypothetical protein J3R72DRAFT_444164 [Linnemannia gamsii]